MPHFNNTPGADTFKSAAHNLWAYAGSSCECAHLNNGFKGREEGVGCKSTAHRLHFMGVKIEHMLILGTDEVEG